MGVEAYRRPNNDSGVNEKLSEFRARHFSSNLDGSLMGHALFSIPVTRPAKAWVWATEEPKL